MLKLRNNAVEKDFKSEDILNFYIQGNTAYITTKVGIFEKDSKKLIEYV